MGDADQQYYVYLSESEEFLSSSGAAYHIADAVAEAVCGTEGLARTSVQLGILDKVKNLLDECIRTGTTATMEPPTGLMASLFAGQGPFISRAQFCKFANSQGVEVETLREFQVPTRPTEVPPALKALRPDAKARRVLDHGWQDYRASDLVAVFETTIQRQSAGFFTLREIEKIMADAHDIDTGGLVVGIRNADIHGRPLTRNASRIPERKEGSSTDETLVNVDELNKWLDSIGAGYRFPIAVPLESKTESEAKVDRNRPQQQQHFQEEEILRVIKELGYIAKALPTNKTGKPGVKAQVRDKLSFSVSVFDKAWERLRAQKELADA